MTPGHARRILAGVRVQLDLYGDEGHLHGQLHTSECPEWVAFSGVLELVAALEALDPECEEPQRRFPETHPTKEVTS